MLVLPIFMDLSVSAAKTFDSHAKNFSPSGILKSCLTQPALWQLNACKLKYDQIHHFASECRKGMDIDHIPRKAMDLWRCNILFHYSIHNCLACNNDKEISQKIINLIIRSLSRDCNSPHESWSYKGQYQYEIPILGTMPNIDTE